jgi:hypothetical protein
MLIDWVQIMDRQIAPVALINQRVQPGKETEAVDAAPPLWHIWAFRVTVTRFRKGLQNQQQALDGQCSYEYGGSSG